MGKGTWKNNLLIVGEGEKEGIYCNPNMEAKNESLMSWDNFFKGVGFTDQLRATTLTV